MLCLVTSSILDIISINPSIAALGNVLPSSQIWLVIDAVFNSLILVSITALDSFNHANTALSSFHAVS
jgi:hypothetical protein